MLEEGFLRCVQIAWKKKIQKQKMLKRKRWNFVQKIDKTSYQCFKSGIMFKNIPKYFKMIPNSKLFTCWMNKHYHLFQKISKTNKEWTEIHICQSMIVFQFFSIPMSVNLFLAFFFVCQRLIPKKERRRMIFET